MKKYLAIDLGASSGRHIVGWKEDGAIRTEEVYRFGNGFTEKGNHLTWDTDMLLENVKAGIREAKRLHPEIVSLSIDTWGVDYVLLNGDEPVLPCYAYRDSRTEAVIPKVHGLVPFEELYARTGIQFQPFNTVYQLFADMEAGRLANATDFLMMPEYLMYRLTGVKKHEYTNATTGGLVNAFSKSYDRELIQKLGLPTHLFRDLEMPGTYMGEYEGIRVLLCPTHDTASAVESLPLGDDSLFLSSGTWSLLGAKLPVPLTTPESLRANFTNEGGVGYIRYLKNIMGLWITQNLRKELPGNLGFSEVADLARTGSCDRIFDVNKARFNAPQNMRAEIEDELGEKLSDSDLLHTAYRSLAFCYGEACREIEALTGKKYTKLTIVGGGAKNTYLNELTAEFTGKEVVALPIEATAIGNLKSQMEADR